MTRAPISANARNRALDEGDHFLRHPRPRGGDLSGRRVIGLMPHPIADELPSLMGLAWPLRVAAHMRPDPLRGVIGSAACAIALVSASSLTAASPG